MHRKITRIQPRLSRNQGLQISPVLRQTLRRLLATNSFVGQNCKAFIPASMNNMKSGFVKGFLGALLLLPCVGDAAINFSALDFATRAAAQSRDAAASENRVFTTANEAALSEAEAKIAAETNVRLRDALEWEFGGKTQRGWRIYAPLIRHLVGAEDAQADVNTPAFAAKVAAWQQRVGLARTGIVDKDTLFQMIAVWQDARIKEKIAPMADRLMTIAPAEWFDITRDEPLRKVEQRAYLAYKAMLAAAIADPSLKLATVRDAQGRVVLAPEEKRFKLISVFRSQEYQNQLRARAGNPSRAALAKTSPHLTGCAIDLYIAGEPVDTNDFNRLVQINSPVYLWLVKNARRFGFVPYFYEPWHWEYVGDDKAPTLTLTGKTFERQ
jgi:D-alanyl-D-alanine carboxypeptidase